MKNVERIAPGLMKQFSSEVSNVAQQIIHQILDQGGQKTEKTAPKIIRDAIVDVYQTPFRLLGTFGKKKINQIKQKF